MSFICFNNAKDKFDLTYFNLNECTNVTNRIIEIPQTLKVKSGKLFMLETENNKGRKVLRVNLAIDMTPPVQEPM